MCCATTGTKGTSPGSCVTATSTAARTAERRREPRPNWGYTTALKAAVRRERPNGEDDKSFPSGHTSNAFALAAVAERHYGWKAGVPACALASVVAVSRLQRNKHHLSDVVAGAAVGYVVGRTVIRVNGGRTGEETGASVSLTPLLGRQTRGLMVAVVF